MTIYTSLLLCLVVLVYFAVALAIYQMLKPTMIKEPFFESRLRTAFVIILLTWPILIPFSIGQTIVRKVKYRRSQKDAS